MNCTHDGCQKAPAVSIRLKKGPGKWHLLAAPCSDHWQPVAAAVVAELDEQARASVQMVPFRAVDWEE
jgi:hypothetical protein